MRKKEKPTSASVWKKYNKGVEFKTGIELYDTVKKNENFFIGKQWEGVEAKGQPTPVFNFLKRVTLFEIATISSDNLAMQASPMISTSEYPQSELEKVSDIVNRQFVGLFERNKIVTKVREFMRNAAVDGDGCTYSYWDPDIETGQDAKGDIVTEILENTRVIFGNPYSRDVQKQPWIIVIMRKPLDELKDMAEDNGKDPDLIKADNEYGSTLKENDDDRATLLLYFERNRKTGTVWSYKCTRDCEIEPYKDTMLKVYPITWMSWDYIQDSYHGQALISQLLPNQLCVNKFFAMIMISQSISSFPKIIFDKTRIDHWDTRPGVALGVNGGDMNSVAKIIEPSQVSPQVTQVIDAMINYTQNFMGASDAALGDTRPDNTSAIIALQRASNAPLELTKLNMYESIEDLGRIYLDFMRAYYGTRYVQVKILTDEQLNNQPLGMMLAESEMPIPFDFQTLERVPMSLKLSVGASSYWSEIATIQTLDNLLMNNKINVDDYLERVPEEYMPYKKQLIDKIRGTTANTGSQGGGGAMGTTVDMGGELPVEGGKGYGALQRAITEGSGMA